MKLPRFLTAPYRAWMRFAHVLGRIMSFILLSALWIVVFGVYAIILKILAVFKKHPAPETYWIDVQSDTSDMRYQF